MSQLLQYDFYVLDFIQAHLTSPLMDTLMIGASRITDLGLIWIIPALLCLLFKKERAMGFSVLLSLILALCLSGCIIKPIFQRLRPFELVEGFSLLIPVPHGSSFPSSHTITSFAAAYAFFVANRKIGTFALVFAGVVAFSRMYLYVHFLSDVLAGALLGIGTGIFSTLTVRRCYRK